MQDEKSGRRGKTEYAREKMKPAANPAPDDNFNQNHNTKKVALGPNTRRSG